uniref:Fungal lipase-like domain-containing protein n=1 Tax=Setaria viridis TaxID=4556 RepID=A0A4U6W3C3_SETVI|nr:hypothetical protein SEVIR_2G347800v2 [Setaria viridis]
MGSDSDKECFDKSGPKHISEIDWGNEGHRRCITACLCESHLHSGERSNQGEAGHTRGARAGVLTGPSSIYGAIFEHVPPPAPPPEGARRRHQPPAPPPHFIVAFRGTKLRVIPDIKDDISIILNLQDTCIRFRKACEHVAELLLEATGISGSGGVVWLAGHSLGASVALDVGRDLVIRRAPLNLPTFLFNPPHLHMSEVAKLDWCRAKCVVKGAAVAHTAMRPHKKTMEALFRKLRPWVPELYVHKDDKICQGYIDHFEREAKMMAECPRNLTAASQGQSVEDDEEVPRVQPHLLPSVRLWKNSTKTTCPCHAHKLKHWRKPDGGLNLSTKRYRYQA